MHLARKTIAAALCGVAIVFFAILHIASTTTHRTVDAGQQERISYSGDAWHRFKALPSKVRYAERASIAIAPSGVYLAVVTRKGRSTSGSLWRFHEGWKGPLGHREFPVDGDVEMKAAVSSDRVCIDPARHGVTRVYCIGSSSWSELGNGVYPRAPESIPADFFSDGKSLFVARTSLADAHQVNGGLGITGRSKLEMFGFDGSKWNLLGNSQISSAPSGAQRPNGFIFGQNPCLAFDELPPPEVSRSNTLRFRCLEDSEWIDHVPAISVSGEVRFNNDGLEQSAGSSFVAIDEFRRTGVDWGVLRYDGNAWRDTKLSARSSAWLEQGRLFSIAGRVWAFRFDQRRSRNGFFGRLVVNELAPESDQVHPVGKPLLTNSKIYGPAVWDLAVLGQHVVAVYTKPDHRRHRNGIGLSWLTICPEATNCDN